MLTNIPSSVIILIAPSQKLGVVPPPSPSSSKRSKSTASTGSGRLNKFVRRLYDMLAVEQGSGVVEWRRGLLVIYSTDSFTKKLLPKYFNTRNFKTFRRQLVRRLLPSCLSRMDDVYICYLPFLFADEAHTFSLMLYIIQQRTIMVLFIPDPSRLPDPLQQPYGSTATLRKGARMTFQAFWNSNELSPAKRRRRQREGGKERNSLSILSKKILVSVPRLFS